MTAPFSPDPCHIHIYYQASFDLLGAEFTRAPPKPNPRGPEMRSTSHLNFFKEITQEQMTAYTPSQMETILQQREHVSGIVHHSGGPHSSS